MPARARCVSISSNVLSASVNEWYRPVPVGAVCAKKLPSEDWLDEPDRHVADPHIDSQFAITRTLGRSRDLLPCERVAQAVDDLAQVVDDGRHPNH